MPSIGSAISPDRSLRDTLLRLLDCACIVGGLCWAEQLGRPLTLNGFLIYSTVAVILFWLVGEVGGLYRGWRNLGVEGEILAGYVGWAATLLFMSAGSFVLRVPEDFSRWTLLYWGFITPTLSGAGRVSARTVMQLLRAQGMQSRGVAIVGINDLARQLAQNIEESVGLGLRLAGFYDDRPSQRTGDVPDALGTRVGDLDELIEKARRGDVEMIYITFPMRAEDRIRTVLERLADSTASVYIVPDFFVFELLHSRWTNVGGLPAVSVFETPFYGVDGAMKRAADLVLAGLILLAATIPMTIIGLAVKLTSRGPIFFRQKRYGLDGREIRVWKFRSMTVCEDGARVTQAQKNDSRITKLGGILRRTSLDELPQLFNVVEGTMSLVGPRPHASAHNEEYRSLIPGYMLRHKVKPGITGLAQVNGWRGETDTLEKMEKRIECDHQYIREWSLWLDLKILMQTALVVLKRDNAY